MWKKLVGIKEESLFRGTLLKFPGKYPFEDEVVMMLCEYRGGGDELPFCLVTLTGHKAGINPVQAFPTECNNNNSKAIAFSTDWLISNWNKWVLPDGDVNDVLVREPLKASEL